MQHERNNTYVNYFDLAVQIDPKTRLSRFIYEGHGIIADNISVRFENSEGKTIADLCSFGSVKYVWDQPLHETYSMIRMELTEAPDGFSEQILPSVLSVTESKLKLNFFPMILLL